MPRVRLPDGNWEKCDFATTAAAWRRQQRTSSAYESSCKKVFEAAIREAESQLQEGSLGDGEYWPVVRQAMKDRIDTQQEPEHPADTVVAVQGPAVEPAAP